MTRVIGGQGRGRRLKTPAGEKTRPTGARVRQTLFDILAPEIAGSRFLDLCAGGGGVGLEALSRGAAKVVLVDRSAGAVQAIRANAAAMAALGGHVEAFRQEATTALAGLAAAGHRFDVVFLDPPYESDLYLPLLEAGESVLDDGGVVVAEHFHKRELPATIGRLLRARSVRIGDHRLTFYRRNA
ncbi:MAG TPA: 16S rRNA (guanine(966)-N(2))-methyltransferase RsmD [Vicinamibacteria bacterium]|jgi:16S rRNA (guanine(966)-N(2))-methyltransferase RsmD